MDLAAAHPNPASQIGRTPWDGRMTMKIKQWILAGLAAAAVGGYGRAASANANVYYTTVDGMTLIVDGADFGSSKKAPHVFVGDTELAVTAWTSTHIEAALGPRLPGTYSVLIAKDANLKD